MPELTVLQKQRLESLLKIGLLVERDEEVVSALPPPGMDELVVLALAELSKEAGGGRPWIGRDVVTQRVSEYLDVIRVLQVRVPRSEKP